MKKIMIYLLLILCTTSLIFAANPNVPGPLTAINMQQNKVMANIQEMPSNLAVVQEETEDENKKVQLSNGKNAEIKVMPETASERALERLRLKVCNAENGCTIELKEIGEGNQIKAVYEIKAQKQVRVLALFKTQMQVQAQVDAENGEVIKTKKPWWAFLALEQE